MKIFLSYRRDDTSGYAGRLGDGLADHFGAGHVFRDVDSIRAGVNFVETIDSAVASCDVLVAVIGREWLSLTDSAGRRRLDDPDDFVRLEIVAALTRNIPVIPVLVEDATMPSPEVLPTALAPLAQQNALELSDSRWDYDVSRLVSAIDPQLRPAREGGRRWAWPALAAVAVLVAILASVAFFVDDDNGGGDASVELLRPTTLTVGYGEEVEIRGTNLPEGKVWFVTQPIGENHFQPDPEPVKVGAHRWIGRVFAGDQSDSGLQFNLLVVVASRSADKAFSDYLQRAAATGEFPGFPRLPEGASTVATFILRRV